MGNIITKIKDRYTLKLFISGASPNSVRAVNNLKKICDTYIPQDYSLEVIDVHQEISHVSDEQIVALPMLIKKLPLPERKLIGDMSDTKKVLSGLGLSAQQE